jgi:transposase
MKAYSQDLRLRILRAIDAGSTKTAVARRFAVGLSTVKRYLSQRAAVGHVQPRTSPGRPASIRPSEYAAVCAQVAQLGDATLAEHAAAWERTHGVPVSPWAIGRLIRRWKLTRKKSSHDPRITTADENGGPVAHTG